MGRLSGEILARVEGYADRVVEVVRRLNKVDTRGMDRVVNQLLGSGTSVGANVFEADEALSRKDFTKCLSIAVKELNETRFWLRLISRQGWIKPALLEPLLDETTQLKKILGAMALRTRQRPD